MELLIIERDKLEKCKMLDNKDKGFYDYLEDDRTMIERWYERGLNKKIPVYGK